MKLLIHLIPEGESQVSFDSATDPDLSNLVKQLTEKGYKFLSPLVFDGRLSRVNEDFFLRGHLEFTLDQNCSRCLEAFSSPLQSDFELALHHNTHAAETKTALSDDSDEVDVVYFSEQALPLLSYIEEQFFLTLPFKPLCEENCKGLCPSCGINKNKETCQCAPNVGFNPFSKLKDKA